MTRNLSWDSDESEALVDGHGYASIADWISSNSSWETLLYTYGFILFRGFGITDPTAFDVTLDSLMQPSLEFSEETSPRSGVTDRIFTSTDYPKDYPIQFHHEFAYRKSYPDRLAFCCLRPAENGGATPLADSRKVLHRIPDYIVTRFEKSGITYIRNFTGLGVSWQDAFSTSDKEQVSDYCRSNGVHYSWSGDDLHTRQTAPAVITHPVTGERAWFNSAINLNVSGIEPKPIRDALRLLPEDSIPTNTLYGTGKQIEPDVIETLKLAYTEEAIRFDWQSGDVLLIDNLLTAHSREPFRGDRKIIVGMGSLASHRD